MKLSQPTLLCATTLVALSACKTDPLPDDGTEPRNTNVFATHKNWYNNEWWSRNAEHEGGAAISSHNTGLWMHQIGDIENIQAGDIPNVPYVENGVGPNDGFGLREHLLEAEKQNNALVQLVVSNLPGRDCWAERSFGLLPNSDVGMDAYREHYIDRIAGILNEFPNIPIALIIEPNSALFLSNQYIPERCQELGNNNVNGYVNGIRYAINTFSKLDHVHIYLDAGAANKFGWDDDLYYASLFTHGIVVGFIGLNQVARDKFEDIDSFSSKGTTFDVDSVFTEPPPHPNGDTYPPGYNKISGFISNARDYVPLAEPFLGNPHEPEGANPLRSALFYDWNPRFGALEYAEDWLEAIRELTDDGDHLGMLIDTSRNGWGQGYQMTLPHEPIQDSTLVDQYRIDRRPHRLSWCNQAGAGIGMRPQANPDGKAWIHAYVWTKPPGESDGNSTPLYDGNFINQPYLDMCAPDGVNLEAEKWESTNGLGIATGALPNAIFRDTWHRESFESLMENAWPPICEGKGDICEK